MYVRADLHVSFIKIKQNLSVSKFKRILNCIPGMLYFDYWLKGIRYERCHCHRLILLTNFFTSCDRVILHNMLYWSEVGLIWLTKFNYLYVWCYYTGFTIYFIFLRNNSPILVEVVYLMYPDDKCPANLL